MKVMFWGSLWLTAILFFATWNLTPLNPLGVSSLKVFAFVGGLIAGCFWGMTSAMWVAAGRGGWLTPHAADKG